MDIIFLHYYQPARSFKEKQSEQFAKTPSDNNKLWFIWPKYCGDSANLKMDSCNFNCPSLYYLLFSCCDKTPRTRPLKEERMYVDLQFHRFRVYNSRNIMTEAAGMVAEARSWELRVCVSTTAYSMKQWEETGNGMSLNSLSPLQWSTSSSKTIPPKPPPKWYQVFQYVNWQDHLTHATWQAHNSVSLVSSRINFYYWIYSDKEEIHHYSYVTLFYVFGMYTYM